MDSNTRRILQDLEPYGVGSNKDISSVLEEMYKWDGSTKDIRLLEHAKGMVRFLITLKNAGLIELHGDNYQSFGRGNTSEGFLWFGSTPIGASITFKGMEMLSLDRAKETDNEMLRSTLLTHASIQQANQISIDNVESQKAVTRRQEMLTRLTIVIAFISAFGTVGSFIVGFKSLKQQQDIKHQEINNKVTDR